MATTGDNVYGEIIDIKNAYYALLTTDSAAAYTPGAIAYLAPTGELAYDPKQSVQPSAYDGRVMFVHMVEGDSEVGITISGVSEETAATLTGKPYDETLGITLDTGDTVDAPWCALSFQADFGDASGNYKLFQFLKGKFMLGGYSASSKGVATDPKSRELKFYPVVTQYQWTMPDATTKGLKGISGDTVDAAFTETAATWFASVQTPLTVGTDPDAIALSSSNPADAADSVAVAVSPTLTFNNAIADYSGVMLMSAAGVPVANAMSIDAASKVITINPTENLAASETQYLISIAGVTDIYGQTLADTVIDFTTIS
jgi:phi13 family phage major tail protein